MEGRFGRFREGVRAVVRQVATAVYVYVVFGFFADRFRGSSAALLIFESVLVLLGAAILTRLVEGPLVTTALVGVFVGSFDVALLWISSGDGPLPWGPMFVEVLAASAAGFTGALIVRRLSRRGAP